MRERIKKALAVAGPLSTATGLTALIYHRVGGGSSDERDVRTADFAAQLDRLSGAPVAPLSDALEALGRQDAAPSVVLTFDDGFRDVYTHAWPLLRNAGLPFTLYLASGFVGGTMHWDGSTARDTGAPALTWDQLAEMVESGLCTVGNHTHDHVRPELLTERQLDLCTDTVEQHLGVRPAHFAYPWGIPVPRLEAALRARFDSAATGLLGRNQPGTDPMELRRVPVRGSDPLEFFEAKVGGSLLPERGYALAVAAAKSLGRSA